MKFWSLKREHINRVYRGLDINSSAGAGSPFSRATALSLTSEGGHSWTLPRNCTLPPLR
jgi:hypothetical protein